MQLARKILVISAIIAAILTIYMANSYLNTYTQIMGTRIESTIKQAEFQNGELIVKIELTITPKGTQFKAHKITYTLYLNNKYLLEDKITEMITLTPGKEVKIERKVTIPKERMFTIQEAIQINKWKWKITGTLFTKTFFGETLIRFKSSIELTPKGQL